MTPDFLAGVCAGLASVGAGFYLRYIWRSYIIAREARKLRKQLDEGGVELFLGEGGDNASRK
jgi:hypothetical protein